MKKVLTEPTMPMREFRKRAHEILAELQKTLLPEHGSEIIAINVDTAEYVVAPTEEEVWLEFRRRWPGSLASVTRVDGGPVVKFHGR